MIPAHATSETRLIAVPTELVAEVEQLIAARRGDFGGTSALEYSRTESMRRPITDWLLTLVLGSLAAGLTAICFVYIPKMEAIFVDFKIELPTGTQWVLAASRWASHEYGFWIFWAVALGLPVIWARVRRWPPREGNVGRGARYFMLIVILLGGGAVVAYYVMMAPVVELIQSVSGPQRR